MTWCLSEYSVIERDVEILLFVLMFIFNALFRVEIIGRIQCIAPLREFSRRLSAGGSSGSSSGEDADVLFSFTIQDAESSVIRVVAFGDIAEAIRGSIKVNELFRFSRFMIRPIPRSKSAYSSLYEIELCDSSIVTPLEDDNKFTKVLPESFTPLSAVSSLAERQQISKISYYSLLCTVIISVISATINELAYFFTCI